ncbi:MAG: AAA family ATPase [Planctomycetaceae bacterium]
MLTLEHVLSQLKGVKEQGNGYIACCPAHDDQTPSLSIREADGGELLLRCHAGCKFEDIIAALSGATTATSSKNEGFQEYSEAISFLARRNGPPTKVYTYLDKKGQEVVKVLRWDKPTGDKTFRPLSLQGGSWAIKAPDKLRPLYNQPKVIEAQQVFVCEGEKAADAVTNLGLTATTSMNGAKSAGKTDWLPLANKDVVILPDCDDAGEAYADSVIVLLQCLAQPPKSIRVAHLPGLTDKEDAFEWILKRESRSHAEIRDELLTFVSAVAKEEARRTGAIIKAFDQIQARPIDWLWVSRIPLGAITIVAGMPGLGKSFLTCDLASRISKGQPLPDSTSATRGSTIIASAEDSPEHVLKPRLEALEADTSRIHFFEGVIKHTSSGEIVVPFKLEHIDELSNAISQLNDCKLLVVDPIGSYMGNVDSHRDTEVRSLLTPLSKLADKYQIAVVLVAHIRKGTSANADDLILGSRGYTGVARSVLHLSKDPEDANRKLLTAGKNNLSQLALAFSIEGAPARVLWEESPFDLTADELLQMTNQGTGKMSKKEEAKVWLAGVLDQGPVLSTKLVHDAKQIGISERTLERASKEMNLKSTKTDQGWFKRL